MAGGKFLASRPVRYHAGSHSFVLRAKYIPYPTAPELGQFLAKSCDTNVAARNQTPILQRDYWDRQLRRNESYSQKWKYVVNNPVDTATSRMLRTGISKVNSMFSAGMISV